MSHAEGDTRPTPLYSLQDSRLGKPVMSPATTGRRDRGAEMTKPISEDDR